MSATTAEVAALLRDAIELYRDDADARARLSAAADRLAEPLRVAIAGMVKAGKSTLLNAIIGEEVAPTGTAECTRVVTWYRHGDTPRVTLFGTDGAERGLPVRREHGRLVLDLGGVPPEDVARLVVDWPSAALREVTLIDTPGIASLSEEVSARTSAFLTPTDAPSEADAVVYLMRHLHASDVGFLEAFADDAVGRTVNALAVLSRADEVGAGRIDALISAGAVAERYARDEKLRSLALTVVPVAGLLAQGARTLRHKDVTALRALAAMDRRARERMLLSADRFVRAESEVPRADREELVERLGVFGIRMGVAAVRGGLESPTELSHDLVRRSGLSRLQELVSGQFQQRAEILKARSAVLALEAVLRTRPRQGAEHLRAGLERVEANAHELAELRLLAAVRQDGLGLGKQLDREAERLLGGYGVAAADRLALGPDAGEDQVRAAALDALTRWRARAESPLTDRGAAARCRVIVRSCEALVAPQSSWPRAQSVTTGMSATTEATAASTT